jgi:hypothetical protein
MDNHHVAAIWEETLMTDDQKPPEPEEGQGSKIKSLREQIDTEYQAAQYGFTGPAQGISKHEFITKRMDRIGQIQEELEKVVGKEEAKRIIVEQLNKVDPPEPEKSEGETK